MFDFPFYLIYTPDLETGAIPDNGKSIIGYPPQAIPGFTGGQFDLQPDPKPVLRFPYSCHFGSCVARNHVSLLIKATVSDILLFGICGLTYKTPKCPDYSDIVHVWPVSNS
jgi:hypothetical protein